MSCFVFLNCGLKIMPGILSCETFTLVLTVSKFCETLLPLNLDNEIQSGSKKSQNDEIALKNKNIRLSPVSTHRL